MNPSFRSIPAVFAAILEDLGDAAVEALPAWCRDAVAQAAMHVASATEEKRINLIVGKKLKSRDYPTGTYHAQVFST
jgi:hypothetical protein